MISTADVELQFIGQLDGVCDQCGSTDVIECVAVVGDLHIINRSLGQVHSEQRLHIAAVSFFCDSSLSVTHSDLFLDDCTLDNKAFPATTDIHLS
jgi:hypothetical protein